MRALATLRAMACGRRAGVMAAACLLAGSAPAQPHGTGLAARDLVALFGPPHAVSGPERGARMLAWEYRGATLALAPTDPLSNALRGGGPPAHWPQLVRAECRLSVRVEPDGRVADIRAEGAACPVVLSDPRRWWSPLY